MASKSEGTRTFILTLKDGDTRKVTVPSSWKLTFGNVIPFQGRNSSGSEVRIALRFYEKNKEDLRAVMTDVVSFREEGTMAVSEKRTTVQRQASQKRTEQGMRDVIVEARVTEWVNPDKEEGTGSAPEEFLKLPSA